MKFTKSLLLTTVDPEDYWVTGFSFPVNNNTVTYYDAFQQVKDILISPEFIKEFCQKFYMSDNFEGKPFVFKEVYFDGHVDFWFSNEDNQEVVKSLSCDFITLVEN